jgi:hypothetical protein
MAARARGGRHSLLVTGLAAVLLCGFWLYDALVAAARACAGRLRAARHGAVPGRGSPERPAAQKSEAIPLTSQSP